MIGLPLAFQRASHAWASAFIADAARSGIGCDAISPGSQIARDGRIETSLPGSCRWIGVSSAPESVVGMAATPSGRASRSSAPMALAASITRPPPSATNGRPDTCARNALATSGTAPGSAIATTAARSATPGALERARAVVIRAYPRKPERSSSTRAFRATSPAP